jgi:hypothetical protein
MRRTPFEQRSPERRAAFGLDRNISNIIDEFARKAVCFGGCGFIALKNAARLKRAPNCGCTVKKRDELPPSHVEGSL